jgi:nitrous oxide reductase accessory protein NosL
MRSRSMLGVALLLGVSGIAGCTGSGAKGAPEALPFIHDDYARALSDARGKKLPIFADVWTPW